jgi:hypothetical protein
MEKKFKYNHSSILNIIYESFRNGLISQNEKIKLKGISLITLELIMKQNPHLRRAIEDFERTRDQQVLMKKFKKFCANEFDTEDLYPKSTITDVKFFKSFRCRSLQIIITMVERYNLRGNDLNVMKIRQSLQCLVIVLKCVMKVILQKFHSLRKNLRMIRWSYEDDIY